MTTAAQHRQYAAAFASLAVTGPGWELVPIPDWRTIIPKHRMPHTIGKGIAVSKGAVRGKPIAPCKIVAKVAKTEGNMKRKEITEAKVACRSEITELLAKIRAVGKVPDRVIKGDVFAAMQFKNDLAEIRAKEECSYQWGTLEELRDRAKRFKALYAAIT